MKETFLMLFSMYWTKFCRYFVKQIHDTGKECCWKLVSLTLIHRCSVKSFVHDDRKSVQCKVTHPCRMELNLSAIHHSCFLEDLRILVSCLPVHCIKCILKLKKLHFLSDQKYQSKLKKFIKYKC